MCDVEGAEFGTMEDNGILDITDRALLDEPHLFYGVSFCCSGLQ